MSAKEADRYAVIVQVVEQRMGQSDAAAWLCISVRQVKRLCAAVRAHGTVGVVSKRRGVPSNRRIAEREREHFVALVRQHYADFGPSLACEYLRDRHDYTHSAETLRSWMVQDGLWRSKRSKPQRVHSPRQRRSRLGELVQIDGSPHAWFEQRAPKCCLIAFIDDASGHVLAAQFHPVESTPAYLATLHDCVSAHGRPLALYSDRHSIFTKHDPEDPAPTQLERALGELNIESILAYSPQAKGRVERLFQTLQDRLVKALRLANISSIDAANAWLGSYVDEHNARFGVAPHNAQDAHRALNLTPQALRRICALHHQRRLSRALSCQFKGQLLVLLTEPEQPRYALRNQPVQIIEHLDGQLEMLWRDESLAFRCFDRHQQLASTRIADDKTLNVKVDQVLGKEAARLQRLASRVNAENAQRALQRRSA